MRQVITVNELAPSLNRWQRMHWAQRSKIKEQWQWLIKAENPKKHDGSVSITYTRVSTQPMDLDGVGGSFKAIGDALVKLGVIEDDNPYILTKLSSQWEKSDTLDGQKSIIEIEDVKVKDQSFEEKFDMYMKCDKEDLVCMLIEANNHIDNLIVDDSPPSDEAIKWAKSVIDKRINEQT